MEQTATLHFSSRRTVGGLSKYVVLGNALEAASCGSKLFVSEQAKIDWASSQGMLVRLRFG